MARRRAYADSERDELQLLKRENGELKREVSKLRRQIARFDLDRFQTLKEALDRLDEIEMEQAARRQERLVDKNKWQCWTCEEGTLRLKIWDRRDGPHYNRRCDSCGKRTSMKKWTPEVKE